MPSGRADESSPDAVTSSIGSTFATSAPRDGAEAARLSALASYAILDTPPEEAFDDLAELAAHLCEAPMALVSLVDADRQWFKACRGVPFGQTPREYSFCAHALSGSDVLVVTDTHEDARFVSNPLVTGAPYLRFYAGAPLITTDGYVLGTLCVLDTSPRALTDLQRKHLLVLAAQVVSQLELRRQARHLAAEAAARRHADSALSDTQRMLDGVLANTDVLVYAKDLDGRFVMTNRAVERATRVEGGLLGRTAHELFAADVADVYHRNDIQIIVTRQREVFTEELVSPDGTTHTYHSTKFPLIDDDGEVVGIGGVSTNVTALAAARAAHQEAEERWRALVEQAQVAVAVIDGDSRIAYANPHAIALCGASTAAALEGHPVANFLSDDTHEAAASMIDEVRTGAPLRGRRLALERLDGISIIVEFSAVAVHYQGAQAVQIELRDVTAAEAADANLRHIAATDPLTGTLNRRAWHDQLETLLAGGDGSVAPMAIALIDLDDFKSYNDSHGHDAGDRLLMEFAKTAHAALGDHDVFARWGGEEFIVALPRVTPAQAATILERIRLRVPSAQTCSIGYSAWQPNEPLRDTIARADGALYQAKRLGRNRLERN